MRNQDEVRRGEVLLIDFKGDFEVFGRRPAVVVQNDIGNRFSSSVIVVPITMQKKKPMPTHVWISSDGSGMYSPGTALCEHIMTVYKADIVRRIGRIDDYEEWKIDEALRVSVDLENRKK